MSTAAALLREPPARDVFDRAAVKALFDLPRETLFARADAVRKDNMGDEVFLRGIVEFSNICANDCLYCGIRKSNHDVRRYRIDEEEILEVARRMEGWQQTTIVLQSGEVAAEKEDERIERIGIHLDHANLPVGDSVGWLTGLEPATPATTTRCSTN